MEHTFKGLPSKQEYVEGILSFMKQNNYSFEEDTDIDSPTICMLFEGEEMYQLSYETDELAPYLAVGKLISIAPEEMEKSFMHYVCVANEINNEMITVKMQVIKDFGLYFYVAYPFPFLNNFGSIIAYSIDAIETAIFHYNQDNV